MLSRVFFLFIFYFLLMYLRASVRKWSVVHFRYDVVIPRELQSQRKYVPNWMLRTTVILTTFFFSFVLLKYAQLVWIVFSCLFSLIKDFFLLVCGGHDLFNIAPSAPRVKTLVHPWATWLPNVHISAFYPAYKSTYFHLDSAYINIGVQP